MLAAIPTYVSSVNNQFFHVFLFAKRLNQVSFSFVFRETMRNKIWHVFCFTKHAEFREVKLIYIVMLFSQNKIICDNGNPLTSRQLLKHPTQQSNARL
jgi:hypothetical protein